jgi:hypothetical protein
MGISQEYRAKLKRLRNLAHTAERAPTRRGNPCAALRSAPGLREPPKRRMHCSGARRLTMWTSPGGLQLCRLPMEA